MLKILYHENSTVLVRSRDVVFDEMVRPWVFGFQPIDPCGQFFSSKTRLVCLLNCDGLSGFSTAS